MPKDIQKRWVFKQEPSTNEVQAFSAELNMPSIIAKILIQRGILSFDEAKNYFRPSLNELHDPFLMKDMEKAVNRFLKAIEEKEQILVYGDYDVDGTTSVALMYSFLSSIHPDISFYIPDRYAEGYGISFQGIDYAADNNFSLIIALDCGIKSVDKVAYAKEKNIDFIICDHHTPGEILPDAIVLDPKRMDCNYPYKELSGCGIGFKLIQAIARKLNINDEKVFSFLDLVTISTAADIVPITGENRILAYFGLKEINASPRAGIKAMLDNAGKKLPVDISDLVFVLAPRINAAGRIHSGQKAVELLVSEHPDDAIIHSEELNEHNLQRKSLDKEITRQALEMIESNPSLHDSYTSVLFNSDWHKGVIGIVASRVMEQWYRPTIMLTGSNGKITGSARSVRDFDIYEAIEKCSDLLEQFGGHKYAAGLTLKSENLEKFKTKFEKVVRESIDPQLLIPAIEIDSEILLENIFEVNENIQTLPRFYRILKQIGPFGPSNMNPIFLLKNALDTGYSKVVGENHLKLYITSPSAPHIKLNGIAFNMGHLLPEISKNPFEIVFSLEENFWNDKVNLQMSVKDIRLIKN